MPRHRVIRDIWEEAAGRTLGRHRAAFYADTRLRELARFGEPTLRACAFLTVQDTGALRLADWLACCREEAATAPRQTTGRGRPAPRESRVPADRDLHRRVSAILSEKPP